MALIKAEIRYYSKDLTEPDLNVLTGLKSFLQGCSLSCEYHILQSHFLVFSDKLNIQTEMILLCFFDIFQLE